MDRRRLAPVHRRERGVRLNVCTVCGGDGVLSAASKWYCTEHLEVGLIAVATYVGKVRGWSDEDLVLLAAWLTS